jgi:hypothetical protein
MDGKTIGIIAVIIIVLIGGWVLLSSNSGPTPTGITTTNQTPITPTVTTPVAQNVITPVTPPAGSTSTSTTNTTTTTTTTTTSTGPVTVTYTDSGFTPKTINVALGTRVTFVNKSTLGMWIASAPHPTHQGYDGTTEAVHCAVGYAGPAPFDECSNGTTFSFTFGKVGTWPYHNHNSPTDFGMVTVVAATAI